MKKFALAFLTCAALVTLGVAISHGQVQEKPADATEKPAGVVVEVVSEADIVNLDAPKDEVPARVEIDVTRSTTQDVDGDGEVDIVVTGDILEGAAEGAIVIDELVTETAEGDAKLVGKAPRVIALRRNLQNTAFGLDPKSREAVEKIARELADQAEALKKEGKADEAAQKHAAAEALKRLLEHSGRPFLAYPNPPNVPAGVAGRINRIAVIADKQAEKIEAEIKELRQQLKKLEQAKGEEAEKERARIEKQIAQHQARLQKRAARFTPPVMRMPGMPRMGGMMMGTAPQPFNIAIDALPHGNAAFARFHDGSPEHREVAELAQKAEALRQAAGKLKEAGLGDQASELAQQAERIQAEADKRKAALPDVIHLHGGPGGPPAELHRAIKELHEQVQILRKEVGALRELLEKKS